MNDFLAFRRFITPVAIQAIFWILTFVAVVMAFVMMFSQSFWMGLLELILAPLIIRIYCELLILLFRIYDELVSLRTGRPPEPQGFSAIPVSPEPPVSPAMPAV